MSSSSSYSSSSLLLMTSSPSSSKSKGREGSTDKNKISNDNSADDDSDENIIFQILGDGKISLSRDKEEKLNSALRNLTKQQQHESTESQLLLIGKWKLLYTTKSKFDLSNPLGRRDDGTTPGLENIFPVLFGGGSSDSGSSSSSSPIQRLVTNLEGITIYQNIIPATGTTTTTTTNDNDKDIIDRVDQLVMNQKDETVLRLSAAASYERKKKRINFAFDLAYFNVLGRRVPYPVPFKLLGEEAKGYLDTKILTPNLRVSTGNKGTSFILKRVVD
eukprot:CAMPEP_0170792620 /NCGR_PEP_ID=MMETSP0733-20121128/22042_1 /TAXON_ID=186038 /ORGANISM="Fragilariopsis kerguelensis, Strain L26-C5" /LENGTH=274 /DNA_ID=CAMNT_0011141163 /DNA_START=279 /DNA_END=1103 /DNA_ORIENTATION=-